MSFGIGSRGVARLRQTWRHGGRRRGAEDEPAKQVQEPALITVGRPAAVSDEPQVEFVTGEGRQHIPDLIGVPSCGQETTRRPRIDHGRPSRMTTASAFRQHLGELVFGRARTVSGRDDVRAPFEQLPVELHHDRQLLVGGRCGTQPISYIRASSARVEQVDEAVDHAALGSKDGVHGRARDTSPGRDVVDARCCVATLHEQGTRCVENQLSRRERGFAASLASVSASLTIAWIHAWHIDTLYWDIVLLYSYKSAYIEVACVSVPFPSDRFVSISLAASVGFLAYVLLYGLGTVGYHLVVLGLLRWLLMPALVALHRRLGFPQLSAWGVGLAAGGAVATLVGALTLVVLDGWAFDPFAAAGASPPPYVFVIGTGAMGFAAGTVLAGLAALRRGSWIVGLSALLAGLLYLPAIPLAAVGHLAWIAAWISFSTLLLLSASGRRQTT